MVSLLAFLGKTNAISSYKSESIRHHFDTGVQNVMNLNIPWMCHVKIQNGKNGVVPYL